MSLIFFLSHQPAADSYKLSEGITEVVSEKFGELNSDNEVKINKYNHIVRKNAHFFVYLVLGVLVILSLRRNSVHGYRSMVLALLICVLYAITDEVHQLFVMGRGSQIEDVLIDSAGAFVGIVFYLMIGRIVRLVTTRSVSRFAE